MKKERLMELAGIESTNYLEEGETWDMIKGMGKVVLIMRKAAKMAQAAGKEFDKNDPANADRGVQELKKVVQFVKDEVEKLNIDDDLKQSTINSFISGMEERLEKIGGTEEARNKLIKKVTESVQLNEGQGVKFKSTGDTVIVSFGNTNVFKMKVGENDGSYVVESFKQLVEDKELQEALLDAVIESGAV